MDPSAFYAAICCAAVMGWGASIGYSGVFMPSIEVYCYNGTCHYYATSEYQYSVLEGRAISVCYDFSGFLGAMCGAITVVYILKRIRRKRTIFVYVAVGASSWALVLLGASFFHKPAFLWYQVVFHGLTGLTSGGLSVVIPLSLISIAPKGETARYGTGVQLSIVLGILLSWILGFAHWLAGALLGLVLNLLVAIFVWKIPDTYLGDAVSEEKESDVARLPARLTYKLCGFHIFQQLSGINFLQTTYMGIWGSPYMGIWDSSFWYSVPLGGCQFAGTLISWVLVGRKVSRRCLWMISTIGCAVFGAVLALPTNPVIFPPFWFFCFGLSLGPFPWFYPAERLAEYSLKDRAYGIGVGSVVNWGSSLIMVVVGSPVGRYASDSWQASRIVIWICSGFCAFGALFGFLTIVEEDSAPLDLTPPVARPLVDPADW